MMSVHVPRVRRRTVARPRNRRAAAAKYPGWLRLVILCAGVAGTWLALIWLTIA